MRFFSRGGVREEELAALADGSLPAGRREAVEAHVAASPELTARLDEQRRAVAVVREAAASVQAPPALRARVESQRHARVRPVRRPLALGAGLAAAVAAAAVVLVLTLPADVGGPGIAEAATLASRPATQPAPAPQAAEPKLLARAVEDVSYPNYEEKFGWRAAGARDDRLDGRELTTVFYEKGDDRIGYTIAAGDPLDVPGDASTERRDGVELRTFVAEGREVVTWLRGGHTCILSGRGIDRATLLELAAWKGQGAVSF